MKGSVMRRKRWISKVVMWISVMLSVAIFIVFYFEDWTGFATRTAWDWLVLLVPVILTLISIWFTWTQNIQSRQLEKKRHEEEQRIEKENLQNEVVKNYFSQMRELLLDYKLSESSKDHKVPGFARLHTLARLNSIDVKQKATIVQFLYESKLIGCIDEEKFVDRIVILKGADLTGVYLGKMDLVGIYLGEADLRGANFEWANLVGANFEWANLSEISFEGASLGGALFKGANLKNVCLEDADLRGANFEYADLSGLILKGVYLRRGWFENANLTGANLERANLGEANLIGAHLSGANLACCNGITLNQLIQARSLRGAIPPKIYQCYRSW